MTALAMLFFSLSAHQPMKKPSMEVCGRLKISMPKRHETPISDVSYAFGKQNDEGNEEPPMKLLDAKFDANTGELIMWKGKSPSNLQENESSIPLQNPDAQVKWVQSECSIVEEKKNPNVDDKLVPEKQKEHVMLLSEKKEEAPKKVKRTIAFSNDEDEPS